LDHSSEKFFKDTCGWTYKKLSALKRESFIEKIQKIEWKKIMPRTSHKIKETVKPGISVATWKGASQKPSLKSKRA
jgi:imidazoleglycerol phosphate synthase glutamine amidotransferase subunit HisH